MFRLHYEIWKPVKGFEGYYEVSNYGNVKSVYRLIVKGDNKIVPISGRIIKTELSNSGYLRVHLSIGGKAKHYSVHRLVAEVFLPNPDNLPQVNHKDENKSNNFVLVNPDGSVDLNKSNLEWCSAEYNTNYGNAHKKTEEAKKIKLLVKNIKTKEVVVVNGFKEAYKMGLGTRPTIMKMIEGKPIKRNKVAIDYQVSLIC